MSEPREKDLRSALADLAALPRRLVLRLVIGRAFHRSFTAIPARSDALKEVVFRIRYDVYCRELGWENPEQFPSEMETDEYDADSDHVLIHHRPSNSYAGCVRLIRPAASDPTRPLPFELSCAQTLHPQARDLLADERMYIGEISRLAVTAGFRRRANETAPLGVAPDEHPQRPPRGRRQLPNVALSLYLAAACAGLHAGLRGVFALMEPRLVKRLQRHGIHFRQMGEPIHHRGLRAPFFIDEHGLIRGLSPRLRALLEVISDDMRHGAGTGLGASGTPRDR